MATKNAVKPATLVDLANQIAPNGDLLTIAEVLAETNEIMLDAVWEEANNLTSHKIVRDLSLPSGTWRKLNQGVADESPKSIPAVETIGLLEAYSNADKFLVDSAPNPQKYRMQRARRFLEGLSQTLAYAMIYGNAATTPETMTGLAPRLGALSATTNVIGAGGTGSDTTSIFVVQWGPGRVYMVYPRAHKGIGVTHEDLGVQTLTDSDGNLYQGYRDHFIAACGMVVEDERCIARIANIESAGSSNIFDEDDLITILNRMPGRGKGAAIYCNTTIFTQMDINSKDKTNVSYKSSEVWGVPTMTFRGVPVRKVDQIGITEAAIS